MPAVRLAAVSSVTLVCFVLGGLWYSPLLFGKTWLALRGLTSSSAASSTPSLVELIAEVGRCFVVTYTFAYFLLRLGIDRARDALKFGFQVWLGFEGFVLSGSVVHEDYPLGLFAIHAGDALVKALISCLLLARWHQGAAQVAAHP